MKLKFLLITFLSFISSQEVNEFINQFKIITKKDERHPRPMERIVNGFEVDPPYSFPFLAFLRINNVSDDEYLCSATLLNSKFALTAAHCVDEQFTSLFSLFAHRHDKSKTSQQENGSTHSFSALKRHENYKVFDNGVPINDIAIIKLKTPVETVTSFVKLASPDLPLPSEQVNLSVVGWGLTFTGGQNSDTLQIADSLHLTNKCFVKSGLQLSTHLCALGDFGQDSCTNDSGGPLLMEYHNFYLQIGIVSTGAACGVFDEPGIYTRVSSQSSWIRSTLKSL